MLNEIKQIEKSYSSQGFFVEFLRSFGLSWIFGAMIIILIATYNIEHYETLTNEELETVEKSTRDKLVAVQRMFELHGMEVATQYCENSMEKFYAQSGIVVNITCTIAAEFYDSNDKVINEDNEIIMPVGMYTLSKNAIEFFGKGWKFRDVSVSSLAKYDDNRYHNPLAYFDKEL